MKGLLTFLLCFVLLMGFLCFAKGEDWNTQSYMESLQFEERPAVPSLTNPDGSDISDETSFWKKASAFFVFVWNCIKYPFEWLIWIGRAIGVIVGGLIL